MKKPVIKLFSPKTSVEDKLFFKNLKSILGFSPKNIEVYQEAFTHSSLKKKDQTGNFINFERLEFLGDAMLGSIVAGYLFRKFPSENEGYLTQMRAKIVSRQQLNQLGKKLKLKELSISKVSKTKVGNNIDGNLLEALIGAIFLDKGYVTCEKFVLNNVVDVFLDIDFLEQKIMSYKGLLIEWCQKNKKKIVFDTFEDSGNQNTKHFSVRLLIDEVVVTKGRATSKKKAEEIAAKRAYFKFQSKI